MSVKDRLPELLKMRSEDIGQLRRNAADPSKDMDGCSSAGVLRQIRFIGVAEYVVSGDVRAFKQNLSEAARIQLSFFERKSKGEPIDNSYIVMLSYQHLLDALAAGDFEIARRLADSMGQHSELEAVHDHPFDCCFGHTLKAFVQENRIMFEWADKFEAICQQTDNIDFAGYARVFRAILNRDNLAAKEGLSVVVKGHKVQSKRGGVFKDTIDETLCVCGIAVANLARNLGLNVDGVPPLIPRELLV